MTATEVWNYPQDETIFSPFCGSVYEDAPLNYLDRLRVGQRRRMLPTLMLNCLGLMPRARLSFTTSIRLDPVTRLLMRLPLHLEKTAFPTVGPQTLNISTRGLVERTIMFLSQVSSSPEMQSEDTRAPCLGPFTQQRDS